MSLINEALKKAQRQRTEGTGQPAPAVSDAGAAPAPRVARREKPAGFRSQILLVAIGGLAVLVIILAVGGVWLWRAERKTEPLPLKQEAAAVRPVATAPATAAPAAATAAPAPANPPPATESKPAPAPVVATTRPAPNPPAAAGHNPPQFTLPLAPAPNEAAPVVPAPVAVADPAKANERPKPSVHMVTIIENLRVEGIRSAGDDSKVLMNDRVYRLNDIIDHDLGLRLTGVTAKSLTFEDDHGTAYTRNF